MKNTLKRYIAFIQMEKESPDDVLGVVFPDFPGCITVGDDYDEAFRMAHEALAVHIESMKENNEPVPEPRSLEQIQANWSEFKNWQKIKYVVAYIDLLPGSCQKQYSITMDTSLMAQIDAKVKNRSKFFADAARYYLNINKPQNSKRLYK